MNEPKKYGAAQAALVLLIVLAGFLSGCAQRNLFVDDDPAVRKTKYWDDESVRQSHEERQQTRGAGFGFANGPSMQ